MRQSFTIICLLSMLFFSNACSTIEKESEEAEARRLARREEHRTQVKKAQVTTLSGLNATELEALESVEKDSRQEKAKSFVYSRNPEDVKRPYLNDLNEVDQARIKEYKKNSEESEKVSKDWVFGR